MTARFFNVQTRLAAAHLLPLACLLLLVRALAPVPVAAVPLQLPQADANTFTIKRLFGNGTENTRSIAVGDLDGDGGLDFAVGNSGQPNVVYLNDGTGNFPLTRTFGTNALSIVVGDLDRDGDLDLIAHRIAYLNDGAGNFLITRTFSASAVSAAVGDLNGDGHLDIAAVSSGQNIVYLNDGTGNFPLTRTFGSNSQTIVIGDVDGDGDLDIVTGDVESCFGPCTGGQNVVYINDGTANFTARNFGTGSDTTYSVAIGDIDGDSDLDIVTGNGPQYSALCFSSCGAPNIIYLNDGTGNFPNTVGYTRTFGTGYDNTKSVVLGDVDNDGDLDIGVGNVKNGFFGDPFYDPGQNVVYLNNGSGNFWLGVVTCGVTTNAICVDSSNQTYALVAGDMDSNGSLDLIVGNDFITNPLEYGAVYLNNGASQFPVARNFGPSTNNLVRTTLGDMDGDGTLDIVTTAAYGPNVLYLNDGAGNFSVTRTLTAGGLVADMNGDSKLDIVSGNTIYLNDGTANFSITRTVGIGAIIAVGDMNSDGALDAVSYNGMIAFNDGTGSFPTTRTTGTGVRAIGDVDGDGDLDVIADVNSSGAVYLNDGAGNFNWPGGVLSFGSNLGDTTLADVDGDGDYDMVVGYYNQQNLVYLNDGAGHFNWPGGVRNFGTGWDYTMDIAVGDVDGDGDLDIVVGNSGASRGSTDCYQGEQNAVYLNDGAGNFTESGSAHNFGAGTDATVSVALGDVDGDGDLDIVTGNATTDPSCSSTSGAQSVVYLNGLAHARKLPNNPPRVALNRPDLLANANFAYSNTLVRSLIIPITYTLSDLDGDAINIRAYYSPDGGGKWYTATAASGTLTSNLTTNHLGYGLLFGGGNDYAIENPFTGFPNTAATVSFWMKSDDTANNGTPFSYAVTGSDNHLTLYNYRNFVIYIAGQTTGNTGVSANDGQWHHIAVTWRNSDGQVKLYKDGMPVYTGTIATGLMLTSGGALVLGQEQDAVGGSFSPAQAFKGSLDEVRLWNVVRTQAQIQTEMQAPSHSNASGLIGYWRFNEGKGSTAYDLTANNHDLALSSAAWMVAALPYVYEWDMFASGFFGASDNVVFRLEAYPSLKPLTNSVPLFQRPYASSTTFPFRVRGTQVRVLTGTTPISNAIVYRLPVNQTRDANPFTRGDGTPFRTDGQGYLQGRGQLDIGDRLIALYPISATNSYTVYATSATPIVNGLDAYTVTQAGVQTLTVSAAKPLLLFNLSVSLEWDARNDTAFLNQLQYDLQRTAELLYDWSNGQATIGNFNVYHDKVNWSSADIRLYATNAMRPNATQGGIATRTLTDPVTTTVQYGPGQVRIGSTWNRYGKASGTLGEDWPRTLAHELGHYLLYLDDAYLSVNANGLVRPLDTCTNTAMADPYRDDYSEFKRTATWLPGCATSLAQQSTGRSEWATIKTFYPWVNPNLNNTGPSVLPLNLPSLAFVAPLSPAQTIAVPIFYLTQQDGSRYQPSSSARAFLFQGNRLLDAGRAKLDQVTAYGARAGDRLCLYDLTAQMVGCQTISAGNEQLTVYQKTGWQPDILVTPITSRTIVLTVTASSVPNLRARLYPANANAMPTRTLTSVGGNQWATTFVLTQTAPQGYIQVWVNEADPRREAISDYSLGGNPGFLQNDDGFLQNDDPGFLQNDDAPVLSGDGRVIIYGKNLTFNVGAFYALQAVSTVPTPPAWTTLVGSAYRLVKTANASLANTSIDFRYAGSEVPPGEENLLSLYFWNGTGWQRLPTTLDVYHNEAIAPTQGEGIYALMSSYPVPLTYAGWNNVAYPIQENRSVTEALSSISPTARMVYHYAGPHGWQVYAPNVPPYVVSLSAFEFGQGYWLSVTQPITWFLKGATPTGRIESPQNAQLPPSTYYGITQAGASFTPTVGMSVIARINPSTSSGQAVVCGQGQTQSYGGQIVYVVHVSAEGADTIGCGVLGRTVTFQVGGRMMTPSQVAVWDDRQLWNVNLTPQASQQNVYLPLVAR
jgi:hypothetical protein